MKEYISKLTRDQEIILACIIFTAFILSLGFVYQGLSSWEEETSITLEDERILFLSIKRIIESSPDVSSRDFTLENFGSRVSAIARNNGVVIDRIQPIEDGTMSITITNVAFINFFNLIKDLKEQGAVTVSKASLRRNIIKNNQGIRAQIVISI